MVSSSILCTPIDLCSSKLRSPHLPGASHLYRESEEGLPIENYSMVISKLIKNLRWCDSELWHHIRSRDSICICCHRVNYSCDWCSHFCCTHCAPTNCHQPDSKSADNAESQMTKWKALFQEKDESINRCLQDEQQLNHQLLQHTASQEAKMEELKVRLSKAETMLDSICLSLWTTIPGNLKHWLYEVI